MKRILTVMMFLTVLLCTAGYVRAEQNIGGVWRETSTGDIKNSIVIVSQSGTALTVVSSWEYRGGQILWQGSGSISGRKVVYQIRHTMYPPGWGVEGTHKLDVSADGRSMTGVWTNAKGESGPLKFEKVR